MIVVLNNAQVQENYARVLLLKLASFTNALLKKPQAKKYLSECEVASFILKPDIINTLICTPHIWSVFNKTAKEKEKIIQVFFFYLTFKCNFYKTAVNNFDEAYKESYPELCEKLKNYLNKPIKL